MEPLHGMYGSMEPEFEVQRTVKRADGLPMPSQESDWTSIKVNADNEGITDGLWRGDRKCTNPKAGDADLWIEFWVTAGDILVEVEHVKAHRTKWMSHFALRSSSLKATRRRMSWQKKEQCWTKGLWRKREQRQCSKKDKRCFQFCSMQPAFTAQWKNGDKRKVDQKSEEMKHRTEWCAEANKYRCMRCGRGSKYMKMPGKCTGPKYLSKKIGKWGKRHFGGHDLVGRVDGQGEVLGKRWDRN